MNKKLTKTLLGDVCQLHRGYDLPNQNRIDGPYPVISSSGISGRHHDYKCDGENVITGRYGTIGEVYYYNGKCWPLNTALFVSNFFDNYPKYIYYFLKCTLKVDGKDKSTVPGVDRNVLHALKVLYFSDKDYQIEIASVLSCIDAKIDLNAQLCAELEAMAKTLYDYWFVQFDFPDENGKPYRTSGDAMEWCQELGREVPKGWRAIDILTLCDVVDCLHSKKPEYFFEYEDSYMLTLENLTKEGYIDLSEKFYISKSDYDEWVSRIEVQENDFVVTNAGRAGDIGKIPHGVKCAIGRNLTAIRPKGISAYYLREYFKSDFVKQQILSNLDSGSFFMSFNVKSIKKMMILIPDSRTLASYLQIAKPIIQRIESIIAESQQLTILRNWLLPMLMNGQVRVADTPSESRRTVSPKPSTDDQAFEQWMVNQGLAARGDADMETYRNIFDAMDEDDK